MPELDPVLTTWHVLREENPATCPLASELTVAALEGPEELSLDQRGHLLQERCRRCESGLLAVWDFEGPLADLVEDLRSYGEATAFGAALRAHLGITVVPARPRLLSVERWAALVDAIGRWAAGALVLRPLDTGLAYRASGAADVVPPQSAGPGLVLEQGRSHYVILRVDRSQLEPQLRDVRLLVVLQDSETAEVLASAELPTDAAEVGFDGDPRDLMADVIEVLLFAEPQT